MMDIDAMLPSADGSAAPQLEELLAMLAGPALSWLAEGETPLASWQAGCLQGYADVERLSVKVGTLYQPQDILVVDAAPVPSADVMAIRRGEPSAAELAALAAYTLPILDDNSRRSMALFDWRWKEELKLQNTALSWAGINPETLNWQRLDEGGRLTHGCSYRRCWSALDMYLGARMTERSTPASFTLELRNARLLLALTNDDRLEPGCADPEVGPWRYIDYEDCDLGWFPADPDGKMAYPCRGWARGFFWDAPADVLDRACNPLQGPHDLRSDEARAVLSQSYRKWSTSHADPYRPWFHQSGNSRPMMRLNLSVAEACSIHEEQALGESLIDC